MMDGIKMELISRRSKSKIKKNLLVTLCGFVLLSSFTYANTTCPNLNINALCINGVWQVIISSKDAYWELMGEGVNGKSCTSNEQSDEVRWNYAFSSVRMGMVGCNYSLFDNHLNLIGPIQFKSTHYHRTGSNWEKESYPGNWTCHESQETCLFN